LALTSYQICVIATRQSIVALANLLEHPEAACMHVKALKTPKKNTPKKRHSRNESREKIFENCK